jgi:hypothetical protein
MIALQMDLPGTQELFIISLMLLLLVVPVVLVVGVVLLVLRWRSDGGEAEE